MSKAIILYNYNQYYNRTIFRKDTFAEYQALITPVSENTPAQYRGLLREDFNFDYNDGVHASKVLNIAKNEESFYKVNHPNYIVVEESWNEGTLEEPVITKNLTRWFILDCKKVRGCQFELSLRRDLIADFYPNLLTAPCFIERGNPIIDDPAIFNKEGFTFNQIKKHELLLNNTKLSGKGGGWIVGYLARSSNESDIHATGHQELPPSALIPDYSTLPAGLKTLITNGFGYKTLYKWYTDLCIYTGTTTRNTRIKEEGQFTTGVVVDGSGISSLQPKITFVNISLSNARIILKNQYELLDNTSYAIKTKIDDWYASLGLTNRFTTDYDETYNNMIIQKDGKYYKIVITKVGSEILQSTPQYTQAQMEAGYNSLCVSFKKLVENTVASSDNIFENIPTATGKVVCFHKPEQEYSFYLEPVDFQEINCTIHKERNENLDAPYDLFCIPMGEVGVKNNGVLQFTTMVNTALAMARGIAIAGTSSKVYDIQVLPYCPYPDMINSDGDIDIYQYVENKDFDYITQTVGGTTTNLGIVLYPRSCRGTFDLSIPASFEGYEEYCVEDTTSAITKKIKSETQVARFVSPNFSAMFEINAQKNAGISELNVDYFYKPYSPYIHVAPYFSGLYGRDFNDPKGLICSGDFSISTAQSQWELYQIQNKNYELIFNRQIENLDINNSIAYEQQEISGKLNAISTGINGAVSGALSGGLASGGNPFAAIGGAIVGGVASGVISAYGAQKDLEFLSRSQQEARSYSVDMYTYNLGNIKALPNTLTKVSSLTENNKIFPFIEFYDCTDEEKEALRNKIKYNGMTIMRIGTIENFIDGDRNYVQAQLIRMLNLIEDSHVVSELAKEIKQGAYYYGDDTVQP